MTFMRSLDVAVQFLTVLPVCGAPPRDMTEIGSSAWAFPLAGALIGGILGVTHNRMTGHVPPLLAGTLAVGLWIALTGGLHLDGWADCCDGLMVPASLERRREIMKDSRVGTFGAAGLILLIGVTTACRGDDGFTSLAVYLAPGVGRTVLLLGCYGVQPPDIGMGGDFIRGVALMPDRAVWAAALMGFVPCLLAGWAGVFGVAAAVGTALWFRGFSLSRLGVVNGDVIGAMCELSEAVFLVVMSWK